MYQNIVRALFTVKESVVSFIKYHVLSVFPSHVIEVVHHYQNSSEVIYRAKTIFSSWTDAYQRTLYASLEGYHSIRVWNSGQYMFHNYYLSGVELNRALGLRNLTSWFALSDFGMITLLASYMHSIQNNKQKILAIIIHGEDVTHILKPYIESLSIPRNVTAEAVCMLYNHLTGNPYKKDDDFIVIFIDYDLNEFERKNNQYMFE